MTAKAPVREALWPFALDVYGRPGVETAMLELQDAHGHCVPYLLWALWLDASGRSWDAALLGVGAVMARGWQEVAVEPLRKVRRELKAPIKPMQPRDQQRLRERVKALELDAERMLLGMLEAASPSPGGARRGPSASLAAAIEAWGGPAPQTALEGLAKLVA